MIDRAQKEYAEADRDVDTLDAILDDARGDLADAQKIIDIYDTKMADPAQRDATWNDGPFRKQVELAREEVARIDNLKQTRARAARARDAALDKLRRYGVTPTCEEPPVDSGLMLAPGGQNGQFAVANPPSFTNVSSDGFDVDFSDPIVADAVNVANTCCEPGVQKMAIQIAGGQIAVAPARPRMAAAPRLLPLLRDWITSLFGETLHAAPGDAAPIQAVMTSLGASQGEAVQLRIVNEGPVPIRLSGDGVILEPIKRSARGQMQKALEKVESKLAGAKTVNAEGYCVDFALAPPDKGMLFRIAPPEVQARYASTRRVLRAATKVNAWGLLRPDSDPKEYIESIKQYAVWAQIERWDLEKFSAAWRSMTEKRLKAAKRPYSSQMDAALQLAAPRRWRDIQAILMLAN
jgi:hypothetical protein